MGNQPSEISALLADRIDDLALFLFGPPKTKSHLEWRYGTSGKLSIVVAGDKKGCFFDFKANRGGDALGLVQHAFGGSLSNAMSWSIAWLGGADMINAAPPKKSANIAKGRGAVRQLERAGLGLGLFKEAVPVDGTLVEAYLRARAAWPVIPFRDVRFHPDCPMGMTRAPCMLALFRDINTNQPVSIHRTALLPDGSDRDRVLGKRILGPRHGAVIKLCADEDVVYGLGITEGVETALSMMSAGWHSVWAAGDAGGVECFPVLDGVEHLTIFADNDGSGRGQAAARSCAERWARAMRTVTIHTPREIDTDWNDCVAEIGR